jgi:hypothetical protein
MRCPLLQIEIPCTRDHPWCGYCERAGGGQAATASPPPSHQAPAGGRVKTCADCHRPFTPTSNRQGRCSPCGVRHQKVKNAGHQAAWRARRNASRKELKHENQVDA